MRGIAMSEVADVVRAVVAVFWVALAVVVLFMLRGLIQNSGALSRLSVGATGVSMEFVTERLTAVASATSGSESEPDVPAQLAVFRRLQRNADLLKGARILWVDDHPESVVAVVDILTQYGTAVLLAQSNRDALRLTSTTSFDAIVSDIGRDDEGPDSDLKGVELAEELHDRTGQKVILFTARFRIATVPNRTVAERLHVAGIVEQAVLGITNEIEEVLHFILDAVERRRS